jgi:cell fate (sporulation/competence/biofilm development) regulator YlbF (YheA/YmcA/DUF963 family)
MGIFEIAEMLGKTLKEDERLVRLAKAKEAYEKDEALSGILIEFEVQQKAMENEMVKPERDEELLRMIRARIEALYKEIAENRVFIELNEAQTEVNELMNSVNNTIMFNITGELPSSCTHDCSTCGGCH